MKNPETAFALGLETSTDHASIALVSQAGLIAQVTIDDYKRHATDLLPSLRAMMTTHGLDASDCAVIGVDTGPGSFTGLRTACAIAQGLAIGWGDTPCLPLCSLEVMAQSSLTPGQRVLAAMDARLGQFYWAVYEMSADGQLAVIVPPTLSEPSVLLNAVSDHTPDTVLGYRLQALGDLPVPVNDCFPTAATVAMLALKRLHAGQVGSALDCQPMYLRDKVALTTAERMATHG